MCEKESFVEIDDIVLKIVRNFLKTKEKKQFTNKNNVRS